ncbi:MAG: HEAT repeat domain-containing protein [Candidatus Helarchaeota archaeon]
MTKNKAKISYPSIEFARFIHAAKQGKIKALMEAAFLYDMSFQHQQYKTLTVLDVLERLKTDDEKVIENGLYFILGIKEFQPDLLIYEVPLFSNFLQHKKKKIRFRAARVIEYLAGINVKAVARVVPALMPLLDESDDEVRMVVLSALKKLSKSFRPKEDEIEKFVNFLSEKNRQLQLEAVEFLVRKSEESQKYLSDIITSLINLLSIRPLQPKITELMHVLIQKQQDKLVIELSKHLKRTNPPVRHFLWLFLLEYSESKTHYLLPIIKPLISILQREKQPDELAIAILVRLSETEGNSLVVQQEDIIQIFKNSKKINRIPIALVLINICRFMKETKPVIDVVKDMVKVWKKRFPTKVLLAKQITEFLVRFSELSTRYIEAEETCKRFWKKFPFIEDSRIQYLMGELLFFQNRFSQSRIHLDRALKSNDAFIKGHALLLKTLSLLYEYQIKEANDFFKQKGLMLLKDGENKLPPQQKLILEKLRSVAASLISLKYDDAKNFLMEYHEVSGFLSPWDRKRNAWELKQLNIFRSHFEALESL